MAWRAAYSLQVLKAQLDATFPGWLFLGFIGDPAHASVPSDHNPNASGVVCALDIGPGGGLDIHGLANRLAASPHPDLKYIISNRRIAEWQYGFKWRPYSGSDPHNTHIHVSVGRGSDGKSIQPYDDRNRWNITGNGGEPMVNGNDINEIFTSALFRLPNAEEVRRYDGKITGGDLARELNGSAERKQLLKDVLLDEEGARILTAGILQRPEQFPTTPDIRAHIGGRANQKIKDFWYSPVGKEENIKRQAWLHGDGEYEQITEPVFRKKADKE